MPMPPLSGIPKVDVGQTVQDFIDNGETLIEARRAGDGSYTITPLGGGTPGTRSRSAAASVGSRSGSGGRAATGAKSKTRTAAGKTRKGKRKSS